MNALRDWVMKRFLAGALEKVVKYLDGKKTALGAVSFLLWVAIYAMPAFGPEYNQITIWGTWIRDALLSSGLNLDNTLFNAGTGFTVLGLLDKLRKYWKEYGGKSGK